MIVGLGGFIGAASRFLIIGLFAKSANTISLATLVVNVLGSFLLGGLFAFITLSSTSLSNEWRLFLQTGILGAFTTYSTFALESFILLKTHAYASFILTILFNTFGALAGVMLGYFIIKFLVFNPTAL